jgi:hypothetical protein
MIVYNINEKRNKYYIILIIIIFVIIQDGLKKNTLKNQSQHRVTN